MDVSESHDYAVNRLVELTGSGTPMTNEQISEWVARNNASGITITEAEQQLAKLASLVLVQYGAEYDE